LAGLGNISVGGLLNKKSKTYKDLGKELEVSDEKAVAGFLAANPKAITRPLLEVDGRLVIGYKEGNYDQLS
jgi:arsenate reductase-like glutaredoxin family protein